MEHDEFELGNLLQYRNNTVLVRSKGPDGIKVVPFFFNNDPGYRMGQTSFTVRSSELSPFPINTTDLHRIGFRQEGNSWRLGQYSVKLEGSAWKITQHDNERFFDTFVEVRSFYQLQNFYSSNFSALELEPLPFIFTEELKNRLGLHQSMRLSSEFGQPVYVVDEFNRENSSIITFYNLPVSQSGHDIVLIRGRSHAKVKEISEDAGKVSRMTKEEFSALITFRIVPFL
jgi:hypothetical protein